MGIPVIACRNGLIGWETSRHGLGEMVDVTDHEEILQAILKLVSDKTLRATYGNNGLRLAARHSGTRFGEAVCDIFNSTSALGIDPDIGRVHSDELRHSRNEK
jgi:glycosyltransferase involved in cell wall biosynthesis